MTAALATVVSAIKNNDKLTELDLSGILRNLSTGDLNSIVLYAGNSVAFLF